MTWRKRAVAASAAAALWMGFLAGAHASALDVVVLWAALQGKKRPEFPVDLPADWPRNTWKEGAVNAVDWEDTGEFLWLSELAYAEDHTTQALRECVGEHGYTFRAYYEDAEHFPDSELLVADRFDRIVFATEGSQSIHDWLTDGAVRHESWNGVNVHAGFYRQARALFPLVQSSMKSLDNGKDRTVWFVGHSMGGAVSQLLAAMFVEWYRDHGATPPNVQVMTFGSPKVGDAAWVTLYENELKLNASTIRWVNQNDLVPNVPVRASAYEHAGRRFQIQYDTQRVCNIPDGMTEAEFREAHPGERVPCYDKSLYWLEPDAPEYEWKVLDTSAEAHSLYGDFGYRGILERLVPVAHAAAILADCEYDDNVAPPRNAEGCPSERSHCCGPTSEAGVCLGTCVQNPINCP